VVGGGGVTIEIHQMNLKKNHAIHKMFASSAMPNYSFHKIKQSKRVDMGYYLGEANIYGGKKPFMSSLNISPEARLFCRKGWGRAE
jgi:hypothetical protein